MEREIEHDSFYVTCHSHMSREFFPGNKASSFSTKLQQPIFFGSQRNSWEIGLSSFMFSNEIFNVGKCHDMYIYYFKENHAVIKIPLLDSFVSNAEQLVNVINNSIKAHRKEIHIFKSQLYQESIKKNDFSLFDEITPEVQRKFVQSQINYNSLQSDQPISTVNDLFNNEFDNLISQYLGIMIVFNKFKFPKSKTDNASHTFTLFTMIYSLQIQSRMKRLWSVFRHFALKERDKLHKQSKGYAFVMYASFENFATNVREQNEKPNVIFDDIQIFCSELYNFIATNFELFAYQWVTLMEPRITSNIIFTLERKLGFLSFKFSKVATMINTHHQRYVGDLIDIFYTKLNAIVKHANDNKETRIYRKGIEKKLPIFQKTLNNIRHYLYSKCLSNFKFICDSEYSYEILYLLMYNYFIFKENSKNYSEAKLQEEFIKLQEEQRQKLLSGSALSDGTKKKEENVFDIHNSLRKEVTSHFSSLTWFPVPLNSREILTDHDDIITPTELDSFKNLHQFALDYYKKTNNVNAVAILEESEKTIIKKNRKEYVNQLRELWGPQLIAKLNITEQDFDDIASGEKAANEVIKERRKQLKVR